MVASDSYVILPVDSGAGKKQRTIVNTVSGSAVHTEVVILQDGTDGSGSLVSPVKSSQLPTALTSAGNLKISVEESSLLINSYSIISGSTITLPVSGSLTSVTNVSGVNLTGSTISLPITGSLTSITTVSTVTNVSGMNLTGSTITVPVSGSLTSITNVSGINITGSTITLPVSGSLTSVTNISGINITGSTLTLPISGSVSVLGTLPITGSLTNVSGVNLTGSTITLPISGSLASVTNVSGIRITGSTITQAISGSVSVTGGVSITGSSNFYGQWELTGSTMTLAVTGSITNISFGMSGSVALISSGSNGLTTVAGSGSIIINSGSGLKIKVYDAGYTAHVGTNHYLYFGTDTGSTQSKRFLQSSGSITIAKTFVQPRVSAANEALFFMSNGAETNYAIDVGYVIEA
jgi:uncharacterized protein YjbI with pentapeptide repeats